MQGAEGPGMSWTVAEPDLDPCPLPPGLRSFLVDMTHETYYEAEGSSNLVCGHDS